MTYYYLTVYPMEALVASQLEPEEFASYMAVGAKKHSSEQLIFMTVAPGCSDYFDWKYAKEHSVPHEDNSPKRSVYLSVYRVLENVPLSALNNCYLVTRDGNSLSLTKQAYTLDEDRAPFFLYQEICPARPLVLSLLPPKDFARALIHGIKRIALPAIIFADIRTPSLEDSLYTGNVGAFYDLNYEHLKECFEEVQRKETKKIKIVDRSYGSKFAYQVIRKGLYVGRGEEIVFYAMPAEDKLKQNNYDWGKSAQLF